MAEHLFNAAPVILIVDDQPSDVLMLSEAVRDLGEVHVASDGRMALEVARFCRPDLVLLDIQMPQMNGFEICRAMKADPKLCDAAILFVTSHTQSENEIKALEYGGVDFIQKPLNLPVARAHVRAHLNLRAEAKKLAYYDALTGLPNRVLLQDRAQLAMAQARREGKLLAVMYLDLDGFKEVNDRLGHDVGDILLVQFAQRLQAAVRASDTVCRQGGDEFVVLLPGLDGVEPACLVARKILAACDAAFELAGQPVRVGVSGGIALFPQHGSTFDELSRHADGAMYAAKRGGRMRFMLYRGPDAEPEVVLPESDLAATAR